MKTKAEILKCEIILFYAHTIRCCGQSSAFSDESSALAFVMQYVLWRLLTCC